MGFWEWLKEWMHVRRQEPDKEARLREELLRAIEEAWARLDGFIPVPLRKSLTEDQRELHGIKVIKHLMIAATKAEAEGTWGENKEHIVHDALLFGTLEFLTYMDRRREEDESSEYPG